ncbi:MAG TPA: LacI family DNA-binding transcriptional regulator [Anaerolineae bacterium]|nr:LacI family DNA-binding transcriptional regulator [Anaerolineae bacterium]HQH37466.1 LacI family DNA-binding transcriptional regulator [Anaerolineae bacterium]
MARKTIADVARLATVSKATVSRVLAGQDKYIRPETRRRVLKAIDELGYRPSDTARSLKSKRSCTLGVVGYGLEFFGPSCTISGIEQEASELGYTLLLHLIRQPENNNVEELLEKMQSRYVDGIIWAVPEIGNNHAWLDDKTRWPSVPIIFLSAEPRPDRFVAVVDNYNGGLMATRHLIAQGCQNIGLISGPLDWWEARQRKLGWKDALESVGLPRQEGFVVEGNWSATSGEYGLMQLLSHHPEIDGVVVSNDRMAVGAFKTAQQLGRHIPEDLAIIGYDDVQDAEYFSPPLSTIRQDMIELGRLAVRKLGQVIEAQHNDIVCPPEAVILQPELIVRTSSLLNKGGDVYGG